MESPVVLDKPPEYHSKGTSQDNEKGFPFDEEQGPDGGGGGGAWSELAARHPDIAARLRARPSGWARKRRSSHNSQPNQEADDFVSGLGEHFNRFPFDDIPPEFREHFPGHWGHRFVPQERATAEQHPQAQPSHHQPQQNKPPQNTISTQTEDGSSSGDAASTELKPEPSGFLPQYGLRNTVDLGQKTPADPSLVDAENERNQRSMSAPPDNRVPTPNQHSMGNMMGGNPPPPPPPPQHDHHEHIAQSNVRHIPIFVEGRDEPIINKAHPEPAASYTEPKPQYAPPPSEREQYFEREPHMGFPHPPPNFSRAFGTPFGKGFRQGPQPFAPQKAYQQSAAPQGQSPPQQHFTQVPVHHQNAPPPQQQHHQQPQRQQSPQPPTHQAPPQQQAPPPEPSLANDPISKILNIQKDVLDLMTEVENFVGTKKDKRYIYLDEMLTRNLIKLDDIETEGKENIRQARREAIKCIQKCIAVLEAKADGKIPTTPQPSDVAMKLEQNGQPESAEPAPNSETKEVPSVDSQQADNSVPAEAAVEATDEVKGTPNDVKETTDDTKGTPKKTKKVVKKRDKSKDKMDGGESEPTKVDNVEGWEKSSDVNTQGDRAQPMETEASAVSSQ